MGMDLSFALRGYKITNTAKVIYGLLDGLTQASAKNGKPYTYISRQSIAMRVGVCEKTVRNALKQLNAVGLITEKRMGRGLNNHIFVFLPKTPQEEKKKTVDAADHSIYHSRTVKNPVPYTKTEKVITSSIDKSIHPTNDKKDAAMPQNKGTTPPKGKPTNKQTRRTIEEKQKAKKRYKDFLLNKFNIEKNKYSIFNGIDEYNAVMKIIELISNVMSNKGLIKVNGSLLMPVQWWSMVKEISIEGLLELIYKLEKATGIKNYRAYILASIYNKAMEETLQRPWYSAAY